MAGVELITSSYRLAMNEQSEAAFDPDTITLLKEVLLQAEETFPIIDRQR